MSEAEVDKADANSDRASFTAVLLTQGRHKFYSLSMPSDILAAHSFVVTRHEDRILGFQRYLDEKRAAEIAAYIDSGLGTIPTAIILSAQNDCNLEYNGKNRTLSFKKIDHAFLIIDGQHRVYGFHMAKSSLRVPVIVYNGLDPSEEAQLFIDINTKQKPVPPELLLDIKKLAKTQGGPEKKLGYIFDLFDSEPGSSLLGRLSAFEKSNEKISRVTFNAALKTIANFIADAPAERVYAELNPFYAGAISAFAKLDKDIDICQPMSFRAITSSFPEVREKTQFFSSGELTPRTYSKYFQEILAGKKLGPLKVRQKSPAPVQSLLSDAMKPKSLI